MSVSVLTGIEQVTRTGDWTVIGERAGSGTSRYVRFLNDKLVIKFQRSFDEDGKPYQGEVGTNRTEWAIWQQFGHGPMGKYLAACYAIADDGSWLIQERVNPWDSWTAADDEFAEVMNTLPIGDLCPMNYGRRADGTAVALDYACPADVSTNWFDRK